MTMNLLNDVHARANLVGTNKMEILLFSMGTGETFGVNVFKVREVSHTPKITRTPNRQAGVEGVISLRGNIIPVISLCKIINLDGVPEKTGAVMIVTEFSRHTQAFLVHDVDRIVRVDWEDIKPPKNLVADGESMITAITELPDGRLVSILDVEQVLASTMGIEIPADLEKIESSREHTIFFVDDSSVARKEITLVLDQIGIKHQMATNGQEAWDRLCGLATAAAAAGVPLKDSLSVILSDVEMPEMDGYVLTKNIKADPRFAGIPVIMHSSLSGAANRNMGVSAGADGYIPKFSGDELVKAIRGYLE